MPYDSSMVATAIDDALTAQGRGSRTRLASALKVSNATVSKWSQGQTTPDIERWGELEDYFGWPQGHLAKLSGLPVVRSVFEVGDLRFEGPPDFIAEVGENVVMLINVDKSDPAWEKLQSGAPKRKRSPATGTDRVHRLQELMEEGEVVRLRLVGSDAEVYAIKVPDDDEAELPVAARKKKTAGARKATPRKTQARPEGEGP